jgi:cell division protein FtsL
MDFLTEIDELALLLYVLLALSAVGIAWVCFGR